MLNTPVDYHTFDHVIVKKKRNDTYKWSCLAITLLLCALMGVMWYWNAMVEAPQRFVKVERTVTTKNVNNVSMEKNDAMDHIRNQFGVISERGERILTTVIDEAEDIIDQVIKAGAHSLGTDAPDILNMAGDQIKQIADSAVNDLANVATGVGNEIDDLIATTIDKVKEAGRGAIISAQNVSGEEDSQDSNEDSNDDSDDDVEDVSEDDVDVSYDN